MKTFPTSRDFILWEKKFKAIPGHPSFGLRISCSLLGLGRVKVEKAFLLHDSYKPYHHHCYATNGPNNGSLGLRILICRANEDAFLSLKVAEMIREEEGVVPGCIKYIHQILQPWRYLFDLKLLNTFTMEQSHHYAFREREFAEVYERML